MNYRERALWLLEDATKCVTLVQAALDKALEREAECARWVAECDGLAEELRRTEKLDARVELLLRKYEKADA